MGTALRKAQRRADKRKALDCAPDQQAARKEKTRGAVAMSGSHDSPGAFFSERQKASAKAGIAMTALHKSAARTHLYKSI